MKRRGFMGAAVAGLLGWFGLGEKAQAKEPLIKGYYYFTQKDVEVIVSSFRCMILDAAKEYIRTHCNLEPNKIYMPKSVELGLELHCKFERILGPDERIRDKYKNIFGYTPVWDASDFVVCREGDFNDRRIRDHARELCEDYTIKG